ncbi:MAG: hypothetical protein ACK5AN_19135 [Planctomyces sp.]
MECSCGSSKLLIRRLAMLKSPVAVCRFGTDTTTAPAAAAARVPV